VGEDALRTPSADIVSARVRWLAIAAGCFSASAGFLAFGWLFPLVPAFLVLGAVVQPRSPRPGKWLMWLGAFFLSLVVLPIGVEMLFGGIRSLRLHHEGFIIVPFSLSLVSVLLVLLCDTALLIDGMTMRRNLREKVQSSQRSLNWLVWIAAMILSVYLTAMSVAALRAYNLHGRLDVLLMWATLSSIVLLFDVALVVQAVKRRDRRAQ